MGIDDSLAFTVLDFGETDQSEENICDVIKYAVEAENLGFIRFWMGEHYIAGTLFSNPEPLIPAIAMATRNMAIGAAGILVRQHSACRIAYSFGLSENLFKGRIDLGLVCPSMPTNLNDATYDKRSTKTIFEEIANYYKNIDNENINSVISPRLWHLTTSIQSYISCQHNYCINLAKSLFHWNSNFDSESDEIMRVIELSNNPKISIAVGCFVSNDKPKMIAYKKLYKSILPENVFRFSIIENPDFFFDRINEIALKYRTKDIIILNLGRSYADKIECIKNISEIFNIKNVSSSKQSNN